MSSNKDGTPPKEMVEIGEIDLDRLATIGADTRPSPQDETSRVKGQVQVDRAQFDMLLDEFYRSQENATNVKRLLSSLSPIRLFGYLLIYLFCLDLAYQLYPFQFLDPVWELEAMRAIADRMIIPLMGFTLLFWGGGYLRTYFDRLVLWLVSWATFWLALMMLILAPLAVSDTIRVQNLIDKNANTSIEEVQGKLREIVASVRGAEDMRELAVIARQLGIRTGITPDTPLKEAKSKMHTLYAEHTEKAVQKLEKEKEKRIGTLWKELIKLVLALVGGGLFLGAVWWKSTWARQAFRGEEHNA